MKKYSAVLIAVAMALVFAGVIFARITATKASFDDMVDTAKRTTEGYDAQLINMVNRLEEELATRASFGYKGGKDPMTGQKRTVVLPQAPTRGTPRAVRTPNKPTPIVDPVKLTAIIFDDAAKKFTAVVMDGERSFSVEEGDRVRDRKIAKISEDAVIMTSDSIVYRYDIYGKSATRKR